MSVRTTVVATVVATAMLLAVSSSAAAGRGHTAAQEAMDAQVAGAGIPGVLAQTVDGSGVWHGAAGVADRRTGRPRLAGDHFRIGSLTKPFVAVVLLQLEAEGRLDLDDPVRRWLPDLAPRRSAARRVTVRELLDHTSGLYDFAADPRLRRDWSGPAFLRHRFDTHTPGRLARVALAHRPLFAPGTGWSYSNTNYVLAGMVVARVTGRPYAEEVERRVLRPLGLRGTSLPGAATALPAPHGRAYSTLLRGGGSAPVHDVTALNPTMAGASGEMVSTTGDLVRFLRALVTGRLLPARQLAEMETTVATPGAERYGLGLTEWRLSCGLTVWGHEGVIHGSRAVAVTTSDGAHAAAFDLNGDWAQDGPDALVEAEYCGG